MHCVWGDVPCTTAVAQYLTAFVTAGALIAAVVAARWAAQSYSVSAETLKLEMSTILVQQKCRLGEEHKMGKANDVHFWLVPTFQLVSDDVPGNGTNPPEYKEEPYDFVSLGRAPIVNALVRVRATFPAGISTGVDELLAIGNFRSDGQTHVRFMIHQSLYEHVTLEWIAEGAMSGTNLPLDFKPLPRYAPYRLVGKRRFGDSQQTLSASPPTTNARQTAMPPSPSGNAPHPPDPETIEPRTIHGNDGIDDSGSGTVLPIANQDEKPT